MASSRLPDAFSAYKYCKDGPESRTEGCRLGFLSFLVVEYDFLLLLFCIFILFLDLVVGLSGLWRERYIDVIESDNLYKGVSFPFYYNLLYFLHGA